MKTRTQRLRAAALAAVCYAALAAAQAQSGVAQPGDPAQSGVAQPGDPARWYVEDNTAQAQLRTLRKEIGAAYQEALAECRPMPTAERARCMKEARSIYQQDMAGAQQQRAAAHPQ